MIKIMNVDPRIKIKPSDLLESPVIIRLNKFNEEDGSKFSESMSKGHETGQPCIPVIVDSYGGQVYSLLGMISEIQSSSLPVPTICESKAMSAGAILFGLGAKGLRYMAPHARLMLHEVSNFTGGKVEEIKADAQETERVNTLVFQLLAEYCGKEKNYFLDIIHQKSHAEWFLTAKEAKKHGLCDHIGVPKLKIDVSVKMEFS